MRSRFLLCTTFWLCLIFGNPLFANESDGYIQVDWNQLIPPYYDVFALQEKLVQKYKPAEMEHGSAEFQAFVDELIAIEANAPMTYDFDKKNITMPGFVVPLDFTDDRITSFLLVPFFGACIHVPPPPPNQIVYIESEQGIKLENINDPIWVRGLMKVETMESELGVAGYSLALDSFELYQF